MKKTILVTGGGGVIGLSIIKYFYQKKYNVIIAGLISKKSIISLHKFLDKKRSLVFNIELTRASNLKKIVKVSIKKFKSLDVLVNCAGIQFVAPIEKYPEKIWRKMIEINLTTPFLIIKQVLPIMRKNKFGRIINIGSMATRHEVSGEALYTSTKASITAFTRVLSKEVATSGITVNIIAPSVIETELSKAINKEALKEVLNRNAIKEYGNLLDISNSIDYIIREESKSVTGQIIYLGGV